MARTHKYQGRVISPVEYADKRAQGYRWYVQTYHSPTGMPWDSQLCPHYYTLAQAKAAIDESARYSAAR